MVLAQKNPTQGMAWMTQEQWVAGRYRCLYKLGRGGFSEVFLAEDVRLGNRKVALKRVAAHLLRDDERIQKFQQEAQIIGHLTNPYTVRAFDYGQDEDGRYYIAMEYVQGETLHDILKRERRLSVERGVKLAIQILDALEEAHQMGVIHRDLKPKNVMLVPQRHGDLIKVLDFGVARILKGDLDPESSEWTLVGTATYMAPEQAQGFPVSPASDIYSVGVILYHMLTGRPPFTSKEDPVAIMIHHALSEAPSMRDTYPELDIPKRLDEMVLRALEKKPEDRFQQASTFCNDLEVFWEGLFRDNAHSIIEEAETFKHALDPDEQTEKRFRRSRGGLHPTSPSSAALLRAEMQAEHTLDRRKKKPQPASEEDASTDPQSNAAPLTREAQAVAVSWATSSKDGLQGFAKDDLSTEDLSTAESDEDLAAAAKTQLEIPSAVPPVVSERPDQPTSARAKKAPLPEKDLPEQEIPAIPDPKISPAQKPKADPMMEEIEALFVAPAKNEPAPTAVMPAPEVSAKEWLTSNAQSITPTPVTEPGTSLEPPIGETQEYGEADDTNKSAPEVKASVTYMSTDVLPSTDSSDDEWDVETVGEATPLAALEMMAQAEAAMLQQKGSAALNSTLQDPGHREEALQTTAIPVSVAPYDEDQDTDADSPAAPTAAQTPAAGPEMILPDAPYGPSSAQPVPPWRPGALALPSPTPSSNGFPSLGPPPTALTPEWQPTQSPFPGLMNPFPVAHGGTTPSATPANPWMPPPSQANEVAQPFIQKTAQERADSILLEPEEFGITAEFQASLRWRWVGVFSGFVFVVGLFIVLASVGDNGAAQRQIQEEEAFRMALQEGDREIASSRFRKAYMSYRRALLLRPESNEAKRRMRLAKLDLDAASELRLAKRYLRSRRYWKAYSTLLRIDPKTSTAVESKLLLSKLRPFLIASLANQASQNIQKRRWAEAVQLCERLARRSPEHPMLRRKCRYAERRLRRQLRRRRRR